MPVEVYREVYWQRLCNNTDLFVPAFSALGYQLHRLKLFVQIVAIGIYTLTWSII